MRSTLQALFFSLAFILLASRFAFSMPSSLACSALAASIPAPPLKRSTCDEGLELLSHTAKHVKSDFGFRALEGHVTWRAAIGVERAGCVRELGEQGA
jgi:hypothetical protein